MFPFGPVVGVVHLLPLPGAAGWDGRLDRVIARAERDARAYRTGGAHALIVENFGDAPFEKERLAPETIAAFTRCAAAVARAVRVPVGVNALRNDARAALGIAHAVGAAFVRINVHAGVVATDQGLIEGRAADTLRLRRDLGGAIRILADVDVKHARALHTTDLAQSARDLVLRAGADAVVVTGPATGAAAAGDDVARVRAALPRTPIYVGSGVTRATAAEALRHADGVIVGTSVKRGGRTRNAVDAVRVRALVRAARRSKS